MLIITPSVCTPQYRRGANPNLLDPDLTNPAWFRANLTITGDYADYLVTVDSTAAAQLQQTDGSATGAGVTFSIEGKIGSGATHCNQFYIYDVTSAAFVLGGTINWTTGAWSTTNGAGSVVVSNKGSGWWKIAMSASPVSGHTMRVYAGHGGGAATAGTSAHYRNAKLETGLVAT